MKGLTWNLCWLLNRHLRKNELRETGCKGRKCRLRAFAGAVRCYVCYVATIHNLRCHTWHHAPHALPQLSPSFFGALGLNLVEAFYERKFPLCYVLFAECGWKKTLSDDSWQETSWWVNCASTLLKQQKGCFHHFLLNCFWEKCLKRLSFRGALCVDGLGYRLYPTK